MPQNGLMYHDIQTSLDSIYPSFNQRQVDAIPAVKKLNQNFSFCNINKKKLIFSQQDASLPFPEMGYEERIYHRGFIATRKHNWHDLFNAMVWHNFPIIKIAINAIHYQELQKQKDSKRSKQRDLLTLFDECGVIIIADTHHLELIRGHKWRELFEENKALWLNGEIQIITFGHAMFEKYLNPYIGMTAKALLIEKNQVNVNKYISDGILNQTLLLSKAELSPLPVLGIPRWHNNQNSDFYANKNYFR